MKRIIASLFMAIVAAGLVLFSGCSPQDAAIPVYDDFSESSMENGLWSQRVTGKESSLEIEDGVLKVVAVNDPTGFSGRSGLNFPNPTFEAFQADFKIVDFEGREKTRVRLEGYAYDSDTRVSGSRQGEIALYFHLRATGQVGYAIEKCDDFACEARTTIARDTMATVNPYDQHTLSMDFREQEVYFQLDTGKIITVNVTDEYPIGTAGWGYASIMARSKESSESITAEIDNVLIGRVEELFGR